jgi:hypothetical protein
MPFCFPDGHGTKFKNTTLFCCRLICLQHRPPPSCWQGDHVPVIQRVERLSVWEGESHCCGHSLREG